MIKKGISLFLCICLVCTLIPSAFAESTPNGTIPAETTTSETTTGETTPDETDSGETTTETAPGDAAEGEAGAVNAPAFAQSQTVDGVVVSVTADAGVFPLGSVLSATKVTVAQQSEVESAVEKERDGAQTVAASFTFDIKILDENGAELQPDTTKGQVRVSFAMAQAENENLDATVYHVSEPETGAELVAEKLETAVETAPETSGETSAVVAETTGFSYYTVEFTYGAKKYVLPKITSSSKGAFLSYILEAVGLTGTVTAATGNNDALFTVALNTKGQWEVTVKDTTETQGTLTVTIDGTEYSILVIKAETANFFNDATTALAILNNNKTAGAADSTWSGDATNGYTLTLNGVNFSTTAIPALHLPSNTTIVLADGTDNCITSGELGTTLTFDSKYDTGCITANGTLTIRGESEGTGSLTIQNVNKIVTEDWYSDVYYCGLYTLDPVSIENCTVNSSVTGLLSGPAKSQYSCGIRCNSLSITNATVTAVAGPVTGTVSSSTASTSESRGIYVNNKVTVNGGTLTATGGIAKVSKNGWVARSYGIFGTLEVQSGTVTATGGDVSGSSADSMDTVGVRVINNISGGKVIAKAGNVSPAKSGYGVKELVTMTGGILEAQGSGYAISDARFCTISENLVVDVSTALPVTNTTRIATTTFKTDYGSYKYAKIWLTPMITVAAQEKHINDSKDNTKCSASFAFTAVNFDTAPSFTASSVKWYSDAAGTKEATGAAPATATFSGSGTSYTLKLSNAAGVGPYYFKVYSGDTYSAVATFTGWENLGGVTYSIKDGKLYQTTTGMEYFDGKKYTDCTDDETAITFVEGTTLMLRQKSNTDHCLWVIDKALVVPAGPTYTVDYAAETTKEVVPTAASYSTDNGATWTAGTGAKLALTPGKTYQFKMSATDTALASTVSTLAVAARPTAPQAVGAGNISKTDTIVKTTTASNEGNEYLLVKAGETPDWSKAVNGQFAMPLTWSGCDANTDYKLLVRYKATDTAPASAAAETAVKTKISAASVPGGTDLPAVDTTKDSNVSSNSITISTKAGYEYCVSTSNITPSDEEWSLAYGGSSQNYSKYYKAESDGTHIFSGLFSANTQYYIYARIAETDTAMPSATGSVVQYTRPETPGASVTDGMVDSAKNTTSSIAVAGQSGYEYILMPKNTAPTADDWNSANKQAATADGALTFAKDGKGNALTDGTEYTVYVRKSAVSGGNPLPSAAASADTYTLPAAPAANVGYTIDYAAETVAPATGYEVKKADGTWSATAVSFVPGATYEVRKAASGSMPAGGATNFAAPARPSAPAAVDGSSISKTDTTVTVSPTIAGQEYIVVPAGTASNAYDWKMAKAGGSSLTFTQDYAGNNLTQNTQYKVITRTKAIGTAFASTPADGTSVTTKSAAAAAPTGTELPAVDASNAGNVATDSLTCTVKDGYEYYISTSATDPTAQQWADTASAAYYKAKSGDSTHTFTGLVPNTAYYIHARKVGTDTEMPSDSGHTQQYTRPVTPDASVTGNMVDSANNTTAGTTSAIEVATKSGYEYVVMPKGQTPSESNWTSGKQAGTDGKVSFTQDGTGNALAAGTEYTVYVRKSAVSGGNPISSAPASADTCTQPAAPAADEGYNIDYAGETVTPASGYEVREAPNGSWSTGKQALDPSKTYEVRKSAASPAPAGAAAALTPSARPTTPAPVADTDITKTSDNITITPTVDGQEYLVVPQTTAAPYDWTKAKTGTGAALTWGGLTDNQQYKVITRKKAITTGGSEAFASEPAVATASTLAKKPAAGEGYSIDYSTEKLTVTAGYEVSTSPNFAAGSDVANGSAVIPGQAYYVRKIGATAAQNSEATSFAAASRPAAPGASVTKADESVLGKGDGKVSGVTADMEYSTDGGLTWKAGTGAELPLAVNANIQVRKKATATAPCGDVSTYSGAAGTTTLTVTFDTQGGGTVAAQTGLAYNALATQPAKPTRTGYFFLGWFRDAQGTTSWDFAADKVTQNITIYAKWVSTVYTVGGDVKDGNGTVVAGASITFKSGSTVVATGTTDAQGKFSLKDVPAGVYNLVAEKNGKTMTALVTVTQNTDVPTIILPNAQVNSLLVIEGGTPDIVVGKLNTEAEHLAQSGQTVTLTLTLGQRDQASAEHAQDLIASAGNQTLTFYNILLKMQLNAGSATVLSETTELLEIYIPCDTTNRSFTAYRYHGNGVNVITTTPNADGEYLSVRQGYVVIVVKKFSTYALASVVNPAPVPQPTPDQGTQAGKTTGTTRKSTLKSAQLRPSPTEKPSSSVVTPGTAGAKPQEEVKPPVESDTSTQPEEKQSAFVWLWVLLPILLIACIVYWCKKRINDR